MFKPGGIIRSKVNISPANKIRITATVPGSKEPQACDQNLQDSISETFGAQMDVFH